MVAIRYLCYDNFKHENTEIVQHLSIEKQKLIFSASDEQIRFAIEGDKKKNKILKQWCDFDPYTFHFPEPNDWWIEEQVSKGNHFVDAGDITKHVFNLLDKLKDGDDMLDLVPYQTREPHSTEPFWLRVGVPEEGKRFIALYKSGGCFAGYIKDGKFCDWEDDVPYKDASKFHDDFSHWIYYPENMQDVDFAQCREQTEHKSREGEWHG